MQVGGEMERKTMNADRRDGKKKRMNADRRREGKKTE